MKKIILTGYMGSGKTTIGKNLSEKLNIPFIDLDHYISEKEGLSIPEIFKKYGEVYFRKKEHFYLNQLLATEDRYILSLGGGTPCYANNHLALQNENVESFYLKASISTLLSRLEKCNNRPLLNNVDDLKSYIAQHLFERSFFYNFSKHTITVDNNSIEDICNNILTNI